MPGCKIKTLEPVSTIKYLGIPSILTRTVGVPCSIMTETNSFLAALSGASRWKELPLFSPLTRFPDFYLSLGLRVFLLEVTDSPGNANASNVRSGSFFQVRKGCGFSFVW